MHYETIWYSILLSCCYCIIHQKNKYSCCCFFTLYCKKKNFKMDFNSIKSKLSIVTGLRWSAFFLALRAAVHLGFFYCSRIHCLFRYFFLFFYSHLFCLEWKVSKKIRVDLSQWRRKVANTAMCCTAFWHACRNLHSVQYIYIHTTSTTSIPVHKKLDHRDWLIKTYFCVVPSTILCNDLKQLNYSEWYAI